MTYHAEWMLSITQTQIPILLHCIDPYTVGAWFSNYKLFQPVIKSRCKGVYCCWPTFFPITWNTSGKCFHSELLSVWRDSQSAFTFSLLRGYSAVIMIWLAKRYFQICLFISSNCFLWVPPSLLDTKGQSGCPFKDGWLLSTSLSKSEFSLPILPRRLCEKPVLCLTICLWEIPPLSAC